MAARFRGDDNTMLWMIQHDTYHRRKGVGLLYAEAELRYSAAIGLLSVTTELWDAIRLHNEKYDSRKCEDERQVLSRLLNAVEVPELPVSGPKGTKRRPFIRLFDHRSLRGAYDTIAAAFRYCNPDLWLPLFPKDETVRKVNADAWEEFWEVEVKRLVQNNGIVIAVLSAVAFQNEETGLAAERELDELLRTEYRLPTIATGE